MHCITTSELLDIHVNVQ